MLRGLLIFGAGVYAGIYVTQNYNVPKVDEPAVFFESISKKIQDFAEENKKPPSK